jgi:hypothetical protein
VYGLSNGNALAYIVTRNGSKWVSTISPVPPTAKGSASQLVEVSCFGAACTAIGQYGGQSGALEGLIVARSGGKWYATTAPTAPVGTLFEAALGSVSCLPASCTIVGTYAGDTFSQRALIITGSGTKWKAVQPSSGPGTDGAQLSSVRCLSAAKCDAVGAIITPDSNGSTPVVAFSSNGRWTLSAASLPANALSDPSIQRAGLAATACTKNAKCVVAVGSYFDADYSTQGLIETKS